MIAKQSKVKAISTANRLKASIKEVAGQAAAAAPSMVPEKILPAPPEKEEEQIPEVKDLIQDVGLRLKLKRLIHRERELAAQEKAAAKEREPLSKAIKEIMGNQGIAKVRCDEFLASYFVVPRSTIKADLLLSQGVTPAQISKATVTTESFTLRITKEKESEE